jgi:uncharacterized protein (UPF0548 family)
MLCGAVFRMVRPGAAEIGRWLAAEEAAPLPDVPPAAGEVVDHNRVVLGRGGEVFARACAALRRWEMFRLGWVELFPAAPPIRVGTTVGVLARLAGLWSLNPCRIVALVEEGGAVERFGFVYRTLPGHAERGEERFVVEWSHDDDLVAYDLRARSRPGHPLVWLGYPLARLLQRRFARDSKRAMLRAAGAPGTPRTG